MLDAPLLPSHPPKVSRRGEVGLIRAWYLLSTHATQNSGLRSV